MTARRKHITLVNALSNLMPILAALATIFSICVLIGWVTNSLLITRINARFIPMAPATALCFVLMGAVLLLRQWRFNHRILRQVWQVLAGIVLFFNLAILLQFALVSLFDLSLDIEQRFVTASLSEQGYVIGRMSPLTALMFILLSSAALLSLPARDANQAHDRLAQNTAAMTLLLAGVLTVGYWYGAPLLYGGTITPVAITTSLEFVFLSIAFLFEGAHALFSHWVMSTSVFSRFTHWVLPGTVGIVLIFGWLLVAFLGQLPPTYRELSFALSALFSAGFIALLTIVAARQTQSLVTKAEKELRESEERYHNLIENSPVGIYRTTPDGRTLVSNPALVKMLGFSSFEELSARNLEKGLTGTSYPRNSFKDQVERDGCITGFEAEWRKRDGTPIFVRENAQVIRDESGAVLYYDGTIEDITERKRVEAALQEAEVRYRALVEQIPAIVYTDSAVQTGQTLYISPQVKTILGYDPQEWMAENNLWIKIMHPDDRERVSAEYVSTNETGKPFSAEYRLITRDGRVVWMRDEAVLMRGQSGNPLFRQGILLDITGRRQAEETLRKSEQFLRQTIDLVPHFIFAKDLESRFLLVNKAVAGAYGTTTSDIVGKSDIDFSATPEQASHFHEDDVAVIQGGQPKFIPEEPITDAQGNTRYLQTTKIPFQFGPDNMPGILGVSVDITERKRAEEKIHSVLEQKDTLLREVHHRVNNILQAIISLMDMHAAQIEDAGTRQFLKELEEQARTMSLVYEQLYQSENLAQVDMALYLQKLASNVLEAFAGGRAIKLDMKIAPVSLDVSQAMPCGLIVNELLTNSLKHAFPSASAESLPFALL